MGAPPRDPGLTPVRRRYVEAWFALTERAAAARGRRRQIRVGTRWHSAQTGRAQFAASQAARACGRSQHFHASGLSLTFRRDSVCEMISGITI